eukprot:5634217-Amphidinium_carterae.2
MLAQDGYTRFTHPVSLYDCVPKHIWLGAPSLWPLSFSGRTLGGAHFSWRHIMHNAFRSLFFFTCLVVLLGRTIVRSCVQLLAVSTRLPECWSMVIATVHHGVKSGEWCSNRDLTQRCSKFPEKRRHV